MRSYKTSLITLAVIEPSRARIVYIKSTSDLEVFAVSEAMLDEVKINSKLEIIRKPEKMFFNIEGKLINPLWIIKSKIY